jgi:ABC-type bacteriocin/lantibiotic exporter with double-glycine peptidase domain
LIIARALVGNPRLLIVDEALDAVQDSEARDLLTRTIFSPEAPWTLRLVTSREDLIRRCGRVIAVSRQGLKEAA